LLHDYPLLGAGIAVVFAIILGIFIDHMLRWWHKRLGRNDAVTAPETRAEEPERGAESTVDGTGDAGRMARAVPVAAAADAESGR
jgi:hypothetical protein